MLFGHAGILYDILWGDEPDGRPVCVISNNSGARRFGEGAPHHTNTDTENQRGKLWRHRGRGAQGNTR